MTAEARRGRQWQIQHYVNREREEINALVLAALASLHRVPLGVGADWRGVTVPAR